MNYHSKHPEWSHRKLHNSTVHEKIMQSTCMSSWLMRITRPRAPSIYLQNQFKLQYMRPFFPSKTERKKIMKFNRNDILLQYVLFKPLKYYPFMWIPNWKYALHFWQHIRKIDEYLYKFRFILLDHRSHPSYEECLSTFIGLVHQSGTKP